MTFTYRNAVSKKVSRCPVLFQKPILHRTPGYYKPQMQRIAFIALVVFLSIARFSLLFLPTMQKYSNNHSILKSRAGWRPCL
jgi:hypothetical protein